MPNNNFEHIIHKHSSVVTNGNPKLPTTNNVEYGEIAVNYAKDHETISLKNSNNEIVTFSSDNAIKKLINDDSYVISNSLNDLNSRIGAVEDRKMDKINGTSSQFVKGDGSLDSNTYATQNYVNNAIAESADLWVRWNMSNGTVTCDTSVSDILAAINAGKCVRGWLQSYGDWIFTPTVYTDRGVLFSFITASGDEGLWAWSLQGEISNGVDTWSELGGLVTIPSEAALSEAFEEKADVASPNLTGTPTAPTAASGTNTTQIATTAFVQNTIKSHIDDYSKKYLTFIPTEDSTFTFTTNALQYSLDNGATWTTLAANTASPTVTANSKILWKQTGLTPTSDGIGTFSSTGNFIVQGNIMSLYYGDDFVGKTDLNGKVHAFNKLFYNCTKLNHAENLILSATTLAQYCYSYMFYGCTSLTSAPQLPATTLAFACYYSMFSGCTSLTTAPELPATTLVNGCYGYMFYGCSNLNYIKAMFTTTPSGSSPNYYTSDWVQGVAASGTFVKNSAAQWNVTGNNGVPTGWNVYTEDEWEYARQYQLNAELVNKVDKVSSTDNAVVRFDGTTGAIQNSSATVSDNGSVTVYDLVVHGNNDTNNTRMISSSNATNLVFRVESAAKMVINPSRITTGTGQTVDLGSSSIPWNDVYGASFITTGGTSSQFVKGDGTLDSTVYATKAQLDSALGDIETLLASI